MDLNSSKKKQKQNKLKTLTIEVLQAEYFPFSYLTLFWKQSRCGSAESILIAEKLEHVPYALRYYICSHKLSTKME